MSVNLKVKNLEGINWEKHGDFPEFISAGDISIGDMIKVENASECPELLDDKEYCLTFDNEDLFVEEPFTKEECKILFGEDFNY